MSRSCRVGRIQEAHRGTRNSSSLLLDPRSSLLAKLSLLLPDQMPVEGGPPTPRAGRGGADRECCRASQVSARCDACTFAVFCTAWTRACRPNRPRLQLLASGFREAPNCYFLWAPTASEDLAFAIRCKEIARSHSSFRTRMTGPQAPGALR